MAEEILNANSTQETEEVDVGSVFQIRHEKLASLVEAGKNPFEKVKYETDAYSADIKDNFEDYRLYG